MKQPPGRAAVFSISGKERTAFSFWSAKRICAPILFFLAEKEKNRFKKRFSGKRIEIISNMIKKDFL